MNVNKKLCSFVFGCLIAGTFVWLISFGKKAGVLDFFHQYPDFVIDYYAFAVTAFSAVISTLIIIMLMNKVFNVFVREHPFWISLPSIAFILLTLFTSKLMLTPILAASIPALTVLFITAVIGRLLNVSRAKDRCVYST